ncbi:MAG TPA: TMEM175 family protein [Nitrososphaeraceae archaeon]|nr:TMEM175 family protein [Nitrososphaeraceae archaeon]
MSSSVFSPKIKPEHIVSFGDAIFAFAITLMTLSIDVPDLPPNLTEAELLSKLYDLYPQVETYIISFAVISIFWILYHQVFNYIKGSHILMVYLNLLFLLFVTFLSITTSLVINYGSYQIPYVIYCIVVIMTSSLLALIWAYATKDHRFVDANTHPLFIRGVMVNLLSIPFVFSISILISFVNIDIAQYFWLIIAPLNIIIRRKYKH